MGDENAIAILTKAAVNFLGRICNPAADEIGLLLQDKVKAYRNRNFANIATKAEEKVKENSSFNPEVNPRILYSIYENGSWSDSETLQNMWAGLLASSCFDGASDQNMLYVDILSKISVPEARLFSYVAEKVEWAINEDTALPESNYFFPNTYEIRDACGVSDLDKLDEAMTHLSALGLIKFEDYSASVGSFLNDNWSSEGRNEEGDRIPDWGYSVGLSLTQVGCRLYLKVIGENIGLRQYIQRKFTSKKGGKN